MKVSCPSCDSKYTIADDKVVGKKIKVRCKTCSTQILVDGTVPHEPDDSVGDDSDPDTWTVNLSESEERKMTTAEIVDSALSNQLGDDVFVWKEGMGDWVLFTDVPELKAAIESAKKSALGASKPLGKSATSGASSNTGTRSTAPKAGASVKPPAAEQMAEKRGPIVAAPGSALAKKMASAKVAAAAPKVDSAPEQTKEVKSSPEHPKEIKSEPAQKAATRLANKRAQSTHDLFAAVDRAGAEIDVDTSEVNEPDHSKATGARNENSVLFSLDALRSGLGGGGAPTKQVAAQAAPGPRKKAPGPPAKRLEDLMTFEAAPPGMSGMSGMSAMGGGGLLLSGNDALLTAPAPPPPKPAPKPVTVATGTSGTEGYVPQRRSKLGLIIGIVAGIAVVGAAGAVIALKLAVHETPPAASADLSAKVPVASATVSPSANASATAVASATAAPDAGAPIAAASASAAPEKVGRVSAVGKVAESKTEKKTETKAAEPSGPAISGTFSKDAAVAALSVAASQATVCKKPEGPWGSGKALVTFAPSGRVTTANVTGAPFGGTPVGGCVANVFRRAKIPAFSGDAVTVSKSFTISP